jgi:heat shock protein HtpX
MRLMFEEIRKNKIKSWLLITIFIVIIVNIGVVIGLVYDGLYFGLVIATAISVIYVLFSYYSGDKLILKASNAREVTKKEFPYLFHTIEGLAISAGMPKPKAYVIEDTAFNAFATGRDPEHASITVTTGLLKKMNRQELEGVVAHEMSHIKNYDVRFMMLTAILVGLITLLSDFMIRSFIWGGRARSNSKKSGGKVTAIVIVFAIILAILSPIIGQIIKFSISRKREFLADANGAILTRYPPGLASALKKIANDPDPLVDKANKATAHLFISTPFRKKQGLMSKLFLTHPPLEERIKRLEEM